MKYFDRNGTEIEVGMQLLFDDGSVKEIYEYIDDDGNIDLGINASNEKFYELHDLDINLHRELYPLYQFDLSNTEVVEPKQDMMPMQSM